MRRYIGLGLVLLLVLTSQSMAIARGTPAPAGQMALCTGTGPVMVYMDEDGQPTGAPKFCPDFALTLLVAVATPDLVLRAGEVESRLNVAAVSGDTPRLCMRHALARGPPCAV